MDISITIPVYNEGECLNPLHAGVSAVMERIGKKWELILVNDGSSDDSEEILDAIAARDPHVKVIHFRRNYGQTAAMMAGFDYAQGDIVIPMDGDMQNDPVDIPKMLARLEEGFDVVSGWRQDRQDSALQRNLPSIMANRLISFVSGVRLHDFGCSLKAYRKEIIKSVRLYGEMHRFLPIYASWHGARITEVVVSHHPRRTGSSKYGLERVLKVLADLLVVKFLDKWAQKPMYLFGGAGLAMLLGGFAVFIWMLALKIAYDTPFVSTPLPVVIGIAGITGLMCLLMGLLAEMIMRTFYESQGKSIYAVRATRNVDAPAGD